MKDENNRLKIEQKEKDILLLSARTGAAAGGQRRAAPEKRPPWRGLGLKAGSLGAARIARRPSAPGSRAGPLPGQGSAIFFEPL